MTHLGGAAGAYLLPPLPRPTIHTAILRLNIPSHVTARFVARASPDVPATHLPDGASEHTTQSDLGSLLDNFDSSPAEWFNSDKQPTSLASSNDDSPAVFYDGGPSSYDGRDSSTDRAEAPDAIIGWRKRRLEAAYAHGKRNFSVKQLAGDTQLSRKEVLAWVKQRALQEPGPEEAVDRPVMGKTPGESSPTADSTSGSSFADRQKVPGGDFARKRLPKLTEATLEKVYSRYSWPPNDMISGIIQLHPQMSAKKIKIWFEERRRNDTSRRRY